MHSLSDHDSRHAIFYRQCACRFPDVAEGLPKPEPLAEPEQDAPLPQTFHHNHTPSMSSSPARMPSPSVPEPTAPMDPVANAPVVPVDPSPVSLPAPDLAFRAPPLPNDIPTLPHRITYHKSRSTTATYKNSAKPQRLSSSKFLHNRQQKSHRSHKCDVHYAREDSVDTVRVTHVAHLVLYHLARALWSIKCIWRFSYCNHYRTPPYCRTLRVEIVLSN